MKTIKNNIIPFGTFKAINLLGVVFYKGNKPGEQTLRHEAIHTAQMRELLYIGFYVWYFVEWIIRLCQYGFSKQAYRNISFEREAYAWELSARYLEIRKRFAFVKF